MQNEQRRMKWCKLCTYYNAKKGLCKKYSVPVEEYATCNYFRGRLLDYKN